MKNILQWTLVGALLYTLSAWAVPQQSHVEIRTLITTFVHEQTLNLPGQVTITVNEIDRRVSLPACPALEAFIPPGGQLLGNSTVGVRCTTNMKKWTLFVPVHIKVSANLLIVNSSLQQGHILRAEDIGNQRSELTQIGILTNPLQAIGKILKYNVGAGQVLKQDMLQAPYVVKQGQVVQIQVERQGFKIHAGGQALNNAAEGQVVQVKTSSGQVVSGVVQPDGAINIRP
ncbi:MAG: flagella basal body P-ring formation protein FlgA [Candidatus Nitrotoga sp. SPKER]|nr:MAG: flagella basal body P-ring formation protein FlgA [Candidatus Nitrotoga sp. SPKER]